MGGYIFLLSCVSVFCGIIHILVPKGEDGALRDNVRLVCALALLCVVIAPIGGFLEELENADFDVSDMLDRDQLAGKYEDSFSLAMKEYSDEETEQACERILFERFDLKAGDVEVDIFSGIENDVISVERADIVIYFGAISQNPKELSDTISELLGCECRIIYK
ncbi:MAG: hypothetical protein J6V42_01580 [Clostridia bacterium]|nr:hypothetical protein [Clostridia bacterium]